MSNSPTNAIPHISKVTFPGIEEAEHFVHGRRLIHKRNMYYGIVFVEIQLQKCIEEIIGSITSLM